MFEIFRVLSLMTARKKARIEAERQEADDEAFEESDEDNITLNMDVAVQPDEATIKTRKALRIVNIDKEKLPLEYMAPIQAAILSAIREGKTVPGVTYEYIDSVVAR